MENIEVTHCPSSPQSYRYLGPVVPMVPRRTWSAQKMWDKKSPQQRAAGNTHRAMAAPAARWHLESEARTAIFRSLGRPQQLLLLIRSGEGFRGQWDTALPSRGPHSGETVGEHNPCSPLDLGVSRNVQIRKG